MYSHFLSKPHQTEPRLLRWAHDYPEWVHLDAVRQYAGFNAYTLTVTDAETPDTEKAACIFTQPHAHEPAATAAMMDFLCQLLEGRHLDGSPTDLQRERILRGLVLSITPDGNPDGRSRSPEIMWDGSKWSNDEFWCYMRGIDPETGKMWKRLDDWDLRDQSPRPLSVGIVYEQVGPYEYVEPNRCHKSAYFRTLHRLLARRRYDYLLDLHQTEYPDSDRNCMILLPILQPELPAEIQQINRSWGEEIVAAWNAAGGRTVPAVEPCGYTGEQAEYFRRTWRDIESKVPAITVEVQNNNQRTLPEEQVRLMDIAIRTTLERALRK